MKKLLVGTLAITLVFGLPGCGDDEPTGPEEGENLDLTVVFGPTGTEPDPDDRVPPDATLPGGSAASVVRIRPSVTFGGTNGTLTIDEIRLVVSGFAMEEPEGNCSGQVGCARFPAAPVAMPVPLADASLPVVEGPIPAGIYDEVEFEIENLAVDRSGDEAKADQLEDLLQQVRQDVADWPESASMYVTGEFTPTDGEPVPFRTFLESEVTVVLSFDAPIAFAGADSGSQIVVRTSPAQWFAGQQVVDLAQHDFDDTGQVAAFGDVVGPVSAGFTDLELEGPGPAVSVTGR